MIYAQNLTTSVSSSRNISSPASSIDTMAVIQMFLIQDYDSQLMDMAKMIRGTTNVKKAYREQMVNMRALLTRPMDNPNEANPDKKMIRLNSMDKDVANSVYEFTLNDAGEVQARDGKALGSLNLDGKNSSMVNGVTTEWTVSVKSIETVLENMKEKLDSLNEQSELNSLSLQTLSSQRKIAFESLSQLSRSQMDTLSTIVRNLKS